MNSLYWVITILLLILCVFFAVLAGKTALKREKRMREYYKKANYQKQIYEKYKEMSASELISVPADEVFTAISVGVQMEIEKEADPDKAFLLLPKFRQFAYAAYYFFQDANENLSVFFRRNGEPLLSVTDELLKSAAPASVYELFSKVKEMLDEDNDKISVDNQKLNQWDDDFRKIDFLSLKENLKQYILKIAE